MIIKANRKIVNILNDNKGIALFLTMFIVALSSLLLLSISTTSIRQLNLTKLVNEQQMNSNLTGICSEKVKFLFKKDNRRFDSCSINDCIDLREGRGCISCASSEANYNSLVLSDKLSCYVKIEDVGMNCFDFGCEVLLADSTFITGDYNDVIAKNKTKISVPTGVLEFHEIIKTK